MSSLKYLDQQCLEALFEMSSGYVLDFTDEKFGIFFTQEFRIDIHDKKYCEKGTSKAKKLREFWRIEDDSLVGRSIQEMIKSYENYFEKNDKELTKKCKIIATKLIEKATINPKNIALNKEYLANQIQTINNAVLNNPELAIGTSKELIETCCKTILYENDNNKVIDKYDFPKLLKETLKDLKLVPEGIDSEARGKDVIKGVLRDLGNLANGIATLRGLYGTGHGKNAKFKGLSTRHARLAGGTATVLSEFLFDTWEEKKD